MATKKAPPKAPAKTSASKQGSDKSKVITKSPSKGTKVK